MLDHNAHLADLERRVQALEKTVGITKNPEVDAVAAAQVHEFHGPDTCGGHPIVTGDGDNAKVSCSKCSPVVSSPPETETTAAIPDATGNSAT